LQGTRFGDLYALFPDGIVLGLASRATGEATLLPPAETLVGPDDDLVMMRPTSIRESEYQPLSQPMHTDLGARGAHACSCMLLIHLTVTFLAALPPSGEARCAC
jgi:hypothetical protein